MHQYEIQFYDNREKGVSWLNDGLREIFWTVDDGGVKRAIYQAPAGTSLFTILDSVKYGHRETADFSYMEPLHSLTRKAIASLDASALITISSTKALDKYVELCVKDNTFLSKVKFGLFIGSSAFYDLALPQKRTHFIGVKDKQFIMQFPALGTIDDLENSLMKYSEQERNGEIVSAETYLCQNVDDICIATLSYLSDNGMIIKQCAHCGRCFIPSGRSDTLYCDNPSPGMPSKTCRQYMPYRLWQDKERGDETRVLFKQIYNMLHNKVKRWKGRDTEKYKQFRTAFDSFRRENDKLVSLVQDGKKTQDEYKQWLESVKKNGRSVSKQEGADDGKHQED